MWPAALGHGTLNAAVGAFAIVLGAANQHFTTFEATIMGWSGWPVPLVVAGVLLWRRAFCPYVASTVASGSPGAVPIASPDPGSSQ